MIIVTVKLSKNPEHDPRNKVTGRCPASPNATCTDVTGEHHSFVAYDQQDIESLRASGVHITRIEEFS